LRAKQKHESALCDQRVLDRGMCSRTPFINAKEGGKVTPLVTLKVMATPFMTKEEAWQQTKRGRHGTAD
jgi:hypothetical protein